MHIIKKYKKAGSVGAYTWVINNLFSILQTPAPQTLPPAAPPLSTPPALAKSPQTRSGSDQWAQDKTNVDIGHLDSSPL